MLWKSCIENGKYDCFETLETFIDENQVQPKMNVVFAISAHLSLLKKKFDDYFGEEMKKLDLMNWICNPFQDPLPTGMSTKASEERIDLSED